MLGVLAGFAAAALAALALLAWALQPTPAPTTFDINNDTGQVITAYTLACDGRTYPCGPIAARRVAHVVLPTVYGVPYTYTATVADGRTFAGTAAQRGDDDAHTPGSWWTLTIELQGGTMTAAAVENYGRRPTSTTR